MPAEHEKPSFNFGQGPSPEVLDYIKKKGWKIGFSYKDVWGDEHAFAFTVAKAMEKDILVAIREAIERAIETGQTFQQFKKDLTPTLQKLGWWGQEMMKDPLTGELIKAQLGSPRRLKVIYRANIRTARSAGQYQRALRTKKALPYFIYELGPSETHRKEHEAMAGTVAEIEDPIWDVWMPSNGWGCKCRVRQISAAEVKRRGLKIGAPTIDTVKWTNERTGEVLHVPKGIDPGWDNNPGKARADVLAKKLADSTKIFDQLEKPF